MAKRSKGERAGKWAGQDVRSIQCWPGGESYQYQGDPEGPADQRRLKGRDTGTGEGRQAARWRRGTLAEWRNVRISRRAEMYRDSYVLRCQSSLVADLITLGAGERGDLAEAFSYDEIENLYQDPSDWDAAQCREYASDQGIELPAIDGDDPDAEEDDSPRGWLTEAREACREHSQDNPAEVYEWWLVDPWLLRQLREIGEVVIDNDYGEWWGRCCTGQQYIMDGVLQRIAERWERDGVEGGE